MKDVTGKEIKIGNKVATNEVGYTCSLVVGVVEAFTPKKVKIRLSDKSHLTKFPEQCCVIVEGKE